MSSFARNRRSQDLPLILTAWILLGMCTRAYGADVTGDVDALRSLRTAWQERQSKLQSLELSFVEDRLYPAGVLRRLGGAASSIDHDVEKSDTYRVLLKGEKLFRMDRSGDEWYSDREKFLTRTYVSAHGGSDSRSFYSEAESDESTYPTGFMYMEQSDWDNRHVLPILCHFRPFNEQFAPYEAEEYIVTTANVTVNAISCRVFRPRRNDGAPAYVYYVDPASEWSIVRYQKQSGSRVLWSIDVELERREDFGIVPGGWSETLLDAEENLLEAGKTVVNEMSVNKGLDDTLFNFEFPPGTLVTDRTGAGRPEVYLVRANGEKRVVTRAERRGGINYNRYLHTESGAAVDEITSRKFGPFVYFNAAVIAVLAVLIASRWRRRLTSS
jgi:hypothetical protein